MRPSIGEEDRSESLSALEPPGELLKHKSGVGAEGPHFSQGCWSRITLLSMWGTRQCSRGDGSVDPGSQGGLLAHEGLR